MAFSAQLTGNHSADPDYTSRRQRASRSYADFGAYINKRPDVYRPRALPVVRPKRRVAAAQDRAASNRDPIGKIYFVSGRNNTAIAQEESWINRINYVWFGHGIYFIHPDNLRISSQVNLVAASDDIKVADSYVVANLELLNSDDQIKVSNLNIVFDAAFPRIDDA